MDQDLLPYLLALHRERDWARAARACGVSEAEFVHQLRAAERDYGQPLVQPGLPFQGFTEGGQAVLAWAQDFSDAVNSLKHDFSRARRRQQVAPLLERRSISPKRLAGPGPDDEAIDLMIQAALCAPDHGGLHPWRVLVFAPEQRAQLAELFAQEKLRRDPLAPAEDLRRAREHATRSPVLLGFIVAPQPRTRVPEREQTLAAGAALGNLLNAAHQLGYGAILLSGERCYDRVLATALGLSPTESLAGFISLGSVIHAPPPRKPTPPEAVRVRWVPGGAASAATPSGTAAAASPVQPSRS